MRVGYAMNRRVCSGTSEHYHEITPQLIDATQFLMPTLEVTTQAKIEVKSE